MATINKDNPVYVCMTDKALSGWGLAKGKINKLVIICETEEEVDFAYNKALNRSEMIYVNICYRKPHYNPDRYYTSWYTKEKSKGWYPSKKEEKEEEEKLETL